MKHELILITDETPPVGTITIVRTSEGYDHCRYFWLVKND